EIGWSWYPEIIEVSSTATAQGLAAGTYTYTAVYEQVIGGRVHRSAPATPIEAEIDNGVAETYTATINVKCNTLSNRFDVDLDLPPAQIVVYRADPGSTVFRRLYGAIAGGTNEIQTTAHNLPDSASVSITDAVASVADLDPLPWSFVDGAWTPLVPTMPPAASVGCVWRNRLMLSPSEEPHTIWYSLEIQPAPGSAIVAAPEFSAANVYRFDAEALRITAMVPMDDHVIVFGDDAIYTLDGQFNNDAGFGASLALTLVHRGIGCIDQRSVVRTSEGVFFQSARGIEFMDKGWGLSSLTIGSLVEDDVRAAGNLRAAHWLEEERQVRFV